MLAQSYKDFRLTQLKPILFLFLINWSLASPVFSAELLDLQQAQVLRLSKTPDLTQTDPRAGFAGGGTQYCCPVVVANVLRMWADTDAKDLLPTSEGITPFEQQVASTKRLASKQFMKTSLKNGTGVDNMINGSKRYVESYGKATLSVDYYGWRQGAPIDSNRGDLPRIDWIRDTLQEPFSAILLNIGWYKQPSQDEYHRFGGHWVLLAAYDPSRDNRYFIVDPSPRAGITKSVQQISLKQVKSGQLLGSKQGLPTFATGRLLIIGGLKSKPATDAALVDAVVAITLKAKPRDE